MALDTMDYGNMLSANNDINIQALQNLYYNYYFHQETQMDMGALALQIAVAVAVGAVTCGAGFVALGAAGGFMAGATAGAIAASQAMGAQYAIAAVTSGGEHGTEQIQSGDADSTTTRSSTLITSSLLFGGTLNLNAGNDANTQTANIKADNVTQEVKQSSTTSQISTHTDIEPDYGSIAKGAAITGAIAGAAVVAGEYIAQTKAEYLKNHPESKWMEQGNSNFKSGTMENSKVGVNAHYENSVLVSDSSGLPVNKWTSNESPILKPLNLKPGMPSGSYFHDALNLASPWNEITILPALVLSDFSACGALCAGAVTKSETETQKDTTTNTITINN